jgi:hypothetical protein
MQHKRKQAWGYGPIIVCVCVCVCVCECVFRCVCIGVCGWVGGSVCRPIISGFCIICIISGSSNGVRVDVWEEGGQRLKMLSLAAHDVQAIKYYIQ